MAHTKQSAARAIKRDFAQCIARGNHLASANDEPEPGDLSEADLEAIDAAFAARKDADCASFGQRQADRAQAEELQRMPGQGYLA
jgi:hypothetical protein